LIGTYADVPGLKACKVCPVNYECVGSTIIPCWDSTVDAVPYKWSSAGEGRCKYFEAGYIPSPAGGPYLIDATNIDGTGAGYVPILCDAGYFSAYATRTCI
jgi:hypothetical protein